MKTRNLPLFLCVTLCLHFTPYQLQSQTVNIGTGSGYLFYDGTGVTLSQINIKAGTYSGIVLTNVNGTASTPVLVINSGGQVVSTTGADAGLELTTCRYVHIAGTGATGVQYGFKLTGGGTGSFDAHFGSSDIEIDHIECGGSNYGGLMFRTYPSEGCQWSVSGGWAIHNMIIHDNYIHDVSGEGMYLGQSHYGNVIANAYDPINNPLATSGYPCAGGNESPIIGAKIYNNIVKNVGYDGIQLSGCISGCSITQNTIIGFATQNTDGQDGGITWNPGSVGTIDRNWIQYTGSSVCMGIMYQGQGDTYITNNVITGGGGGQVGLAMLRNTVANVSGSTHNNIYIYNNTITGFSTGYWWYGDNGFGSNTFFSNNIVADATPYTLGNGNISTLQKTTNIEVSSTATPAFVNYAGNDFHLTAASPAVAKGTSQSSVTTDYAGTARSVPYDIGAYKYGLGGTAPINKIPVADAGPDQTITLPLNTVTLNGSASKDSDGTIVTYAWTKISGPSTGTLVSANTVSSAVNSLAAGTYTFRLLVTDNGGATNADTVVITVKGSANQSPVANAGADQSITLPVSLVTLDGSASTDPDGTITAYSWTKVSGPSGLTISLPNGVSTTVLSLLAGTYVFKLTVTDNAGATGSDSVKVTVKPLINIAPVANAGSAQTITLPVNTANLDGSKSSDADGSIAAYSWALVSGPNTPGITGAATATPSLSGLIAGLYTYQLTVTDNGGATSSAQVKITVVGSANQSPVANAGADKTITLPTNSVTLNGSGSSDPDGTIATYAWTKVSGPAGSTIATPAGTSTSITGLAAGTYVFRLTVTDNLGATASDNVTITVRPVANIAPVADAGTSRSITLPLNTVTLDGTGSTDADGSISGYAWTFVSGPATPVLTNANTASATAASLVAGVYTFDLTVTDNQGATDQAQVKITVIAAVAANPAANAGSNQTITLPRDSARLNGSGSSPASGSSISSYAWSQISGPSAGTIQSSSSSITLVSGLVAGTYNFRLKVTDANGNSDMDSVTVTVRAAANIPPVADAGNSRTIVLPLNSVTLDGTGSSDADGTISNYSWTKISGPASTITNGSSSVATAAGLVAGTYIFQLTVTDNRGAGDNAQVKITVIPEPNQAPVANAGPNQSITLPKDSVTLNGSSSADPDGTISTYSWSQVSGPAASTIVSSSSVTTQIHNLVQGSYVFRLTVTDNKGATSTDLITVLVNPRNNLAPVANAGASRSITLPVNSVTLDGTKSSDADGTILSYSWTKLSGPAATLSNAGTATPNASGLVAGVYVFELTVTDNDGASSSASVKITVTPPANQSPVANAGTDINITLPLNSAKLDGTQSYDPDGSIASYSWIKISGPATYTIVNATNASPTVTSLAAGQYVFQLTITDNKGATDVDQVTVTVSPSNNKGPVANAGRDTTIAIPASLVELNGSRSSDVDGTIMRFAWTQISGPSTSTIDNANFVNASAGNLIPGKYIFSLKVTDSNGETDTAQVTVTVVDNLRANEMMLLYPNPATSVVNLRLINDSSGTVVVNMYDVNGRQVKTTQLVKQQNYLDTPINVSNLSGGVYFVEVLLGGKQKLSGKFLKQ